MVGVGELQARDPALPDDVVHLLGDGGVIQRGQEGEGLEEPAKSSHGDQEPIMRRMPFLAVCSEQPNR